MGPKHWRIRSPASRTARMAAKLSTVVIQVAFLALASCPFSLPHRLARAIATGWLPIPLTSLVRGCRRMSLRAPRAFLNSGHYCQRPGRNLKTCNQARS
jgi:hypothetical protein